jgi:hypothetical protein
MLGNYLLGTDYKYATLEANGDVYIWKVRPEYNRSKGEWDAEDPDARQVDEVDFSRLLVEHPGPINLGYF